MRAVPRSFYRHDALVVAPALLNKLLVAGPRAGRIVEVEAYRGIEDPGSHAYRGATRRNATMFGPPGHLYVYFSYGVHWCANVVCQPEGVPHAVLIRALAPVAGVDQMRIARSRGQKHPLRERDLCRGPGRLCQALGLDGGDDGADLVSGAGAAGGSGAGGAGRGGIRILDDGTPPPEPPAVGLSVRVGLTRGAESPWRFFVAGDPHVSGPRVRPLC
jgi:DNA-3-methyladenine glycosylase